MDFFIKCANVAFSVVLGVGYRDAENLSSGCFRYCRQFLHSCVFMMKSTYLKAEFLSDYKVLSSFRRNQKSKTF